MEEYRSIRGYENLYMVSNMGSVLSLKRKTKGRWGNEKTSNGGLLKGSVTNVGYLRVDLSKNGLVKHFSVHRLVAQAFLDNPDELPCVNHIDSNKLNNHVDNLEWCTHKENTQHMLKAGNFKRYTTGDFCSKGHERNEKNMYVNKKTGFKNCRICRNQYLRELRAEQRARIK